MDPQRIPLSRINVLRDPAVRVALSLIPPAKRRKLALLVAVQVFLGALDLLAVAMVGLLGGIAVTGVQSRGPSGMTAHVLSILHLETLSAQAQVTVIGAIAVTLLLGRTVASVILTRKALHFLALRAAEASVEMTSRLLAQPITFIQARSSQEFLFSLTSGANALVLGLLGTCVILVADLSMFLALALLLLALSPIVALLLSAMLMVVALILHRTTTGRAVSLGERGTVFDIRSRDAMMEALSTYRDSIVRGTRPTYRERLREARTGAAFVSAEATFLPNVSKYVMESAVIVSGMLVAAVQFALSGAEQAVSVLAVFLASGARLAPALIRIQQGLFSFRSFVGQGRTATTLLHEMYERDLPTAERTVFVDVHAGLEVDIDVRAVTYVYPSGLAPAVKDWSLYAPAGSSTALVGPSGGGKSTALDLLLGVLEPASGSVHLVGQTPVAVASAWPGAIGYVPQDVWIANGTLRSNITLGFNAADVADGKVWETLELAGLDEFVRTLPAGLDSVIGERGTNLSGGQRQRLGIARALITRPRLLVLDEATSALDASTEFAITEALRSMRGVVTTVVVAHRLSTVRDADLVQYFDAGRVLAQGSFEEVRAAVPEFARQAQLLGL